MNERNRIIQDIIDIVIAAAEKAADDAWDRSGDDNIPDTWGDFIRAIREIRG